MEAHIKLTAEQREAAAEIERNLQIIACAGSGKTEVITRRIVHILESRPDLSPENIVAFTFTEKAADSMKARLKKAAGAGCAPDISSMYVGTIHGFCWQLLRQYTETFREFKILDTVKNHLFIERYYKNSGMEELELGKGLFNVKLFLSCIEKMLDDYENADAWTQAQREALDKYINCLYSHGCIDFFLLIFETLRQAEENPEVQAYLSSIKYLVVDEYQDINDMQEKLIQCIAGWGANVCVVGDDDQTIYQFRGSSAENMITFSERYRDVHQVCLGLNFRCAPCIVEAAEHVIRHNERRLPKHMESGVPLQTGEVRSEGFAGMEKEHQAIAEQIEGLHEAGIPYREMAVLVRKGKHAVPIQRVLEQAGIPCEADCLESFFEGDLFARFCAILQVLADVDKTKLYSQWQDLAALSDLNSAFRFLRRCAQGGSMRLSEIVRGFCSRIGFLSAEEEKKGDRSSALEIFAKILDDYDAVYGDWQPSARISGVLFFLDQQAAEEYRHYRFRAEDQEKDAVQLMTVHKAKGLEFEAVFIPELCEGEFPVSKMGGRRYWHVLGGTFKEKKEKYQSGPEDERKLFYVAATRARRYLYLMYACQHKPASRFIKEVQGFYKIP